MKWILFSLLLFPLANFAQEQADSKHLIYYEFGGPGGVGSLNYEHYVLKKKKFEALARFGLGTVKLMDFNQRFNPDLNFIWNAHGTYGSNHKAELFLGSVFANSVHISASATTVRRTTAHLNLGGGYRFEAEGTGFFGRASYVFLTNLSDNNRHWAALAIGIKF